MTEELDVNPSFLEYFRTSRLMKVGLAFNLIYYIGVIVGFVFLLLQGTLQDTVFSVDFRVFYEAGLEFANSPADIYLVNPNGLPFRYLPSFAMFMALFVGAPMVSLYLVNITLMMFSGDVFLSALILNELWNALQFNGVHVNCYDKYKKV